MATVTTIKNSAENPAKAEIRVAKRLRELRLDQGLTLRDLAARAQISEATLSRAENHRISISIGMLERLAAALNVPIATFFEEDERTVPIAVCRAGRGTKGRLRGIRGFRYEMLAATRKSKLMEPLIVDIASPPKPMELKSHPGDQFNYVLEGEYRLIYGKEEIYMRTGDAVYFDANVPHASRSVDGNPCKLLMMVSSRDYLFHGDISNLLKGTSV